jgi:putative modified peptide
MPFKLSDTVVDTLLDKLSNDDAFRAQFQINPRAALAMVGHRAAAEARDEDAGIWRCLGVTQLASKEAIRASREVLRRQLTASQAAHNPVNLELAKPDAVRADQIAANRAA